MIRFDDILAADARIRPFALETPLLRADALDEATGARVWVKAECLQPRGAFKIRGAANAILARRDEVEAHGVVAFSSGNHAQAIAWMARQIGARATIVVPSDAPDAKLAPARRDGARIVAYDRARESREEIGARIAAEEGAVLVAPFDDAAVIAGQGTCGLEILRQAAAMGARIEDMVVCASGGGLAAGIALATRSIDPAVRIWTAEPETHDDLARSLETGAPVTNAPGYRSIQDALMSPAPGALTLPILAQAEARGIAVSDAEALAAMGFAFRHLRLVLEPGGAAALAAVLSGRIELKGRTVALTASGGNVDPDTYARALATLSGASPGS